MPNILVIEDNQDLSHEIKEWLEDEGHVVDLATDGKDGLQRLGLYVYDVVVLDWNLPGMMDGVEVLSNLRGRRSTVPVLMLTGHTSIADKEKGFATGADDYLTKPFEMRELICRIAALLRRPRDLQLDIIRVENLELDSRNRKLSVNGTALNLSPKEFKLLELFMRCPDQLVSTEEIMERLWTFDDEVSPDSVRKMVSRVRTKIERCGGQAFIENVFGTGYRLTRNQ